MFDVIIVGAGLSGLTTAYKILQKEATLKVKILEENNKIGGQIAARTLTNRTLTTSIGEVGGKWITADQYHIYNLLSEFGVSLKRRMPVSKNLQRCWAIDKGHFAALVKYELQRYMDELDLKCQFFRSGLIELTPEDRQNTMWHHIRSKMFFEGSRVFMKNFVRLVAGADAKDISYVEFMNVLYSCGGLKKLRHLYIDSSAAVMEFSSEELLTKLEAKLSTVVLLKTSRVMEIQHLQDFVQVRDANGTVHLAKVVVLAIPCNQLMDIFITPPVPLKFELPQSIRKCYTTSFIAQYDEAHWRRKGLSGNLYTEDPVIFAQQYKPNSLAGYVLHEEEFSWQTKSIVLKTLSDCFGSEMAHPVEYYQETFEQTSLLNLPQTEPWNRVIWSSTSAATLYRGCLSGAVQSGLRAALNALFILRPQNITWQDLAEVQKADIVHRWPSCWDLLKSSLNIYNTVFYTSVGLAAFYLIKKRNKLLTI